MQNSNQKLTGKFYHKKTLFGLVLYVEIEDTFEAGTPNGRVTHRIRKYRKATESDAAEMVRWFNALVTDYNKRSH